MNMGLQDKVAIVGLGYTPQGRIPGRTHKSMYLEASRTAIEDAGLDASEIDGIMLFQQAAEEVYPVEIAAWLGLKNIRWMS